MRVRIKKRLDAIRWAFRNYGPEQQIKIRANAQGLNQLLVRFHFE
jgi:hypothetical protein